MSPMSICVVEYPDPCSKVSTPQSSTSEKDKMLLRQLLKIIKLLHCNCIQLKSEVTVYCCCPKFPPQNPLQYKLHCGVSPFSLPSFLDLVFSPAKGNHKSREGKYSPKRNQSRKRTSSTEGFSWQRGSTKQAGPERRGGHRMKVREIREVC